MVYDLQSIKAPRLAGVPLKLIVRLMENRLTRGPLIDQLLKDAGIAHLRSLEIPDPPTFQPDWSTHESGPLPPPRSDLPISRPQGINFPTIADYAAAYRNGPETPDQVAERVLQAIHESDASDPPLRAFIACNRDDVLAQARASTERWRAGKPLSELDGVPVAIKDEMDLIPYPTTVGTRFLGRAPVREDSTVAARLRAAGALLIGKTNMHEIGIGTTGLNPHYGTVRNPFNPRHHSGGSSSGSAAAVAAGLCPVAIGADGGGSIRIPAAFCGVIGLKPTFKRVSSFGTAPLAWSVDYYGPIAVAARDAALAYAVIAGPDPRDPQSMNQPAARFDDLANSDLRGMRLGVFTPWFEHATPAMAAGCRALLEKFREMGSQVCEVEIPELEAARVAHAITIGSEMMTSLDHDYPEHRTELCLETRANLALARALTSRDYVQAQRVRTRLIRHMSRALEQVDAIISPATAITAPPIPESALPDGESDLSTLMEIMRFAPPANMTGHPAISIPAGYDANGLPVGLQAIARPWQEQVLLRLAYAAERVVERRQPKIAYRVLSD